MTRDRYSDVLPVGSAPAPEGLDPALVFPTLTDEQVDRLSSVGREREFEDGDVVWEEGDTQVPFFVVLDGTVAILGGPDDRLVVDHEAGAFTGDVDMLSGRKTAVRAEARGRTRVLEISRADLRKFVQTDVELGEIFLRAFILRRVALIASGLANVIIIGSRSAPGTLTLQEFLTRNNRPFTYVDVEEDPSVMRLLEQFHVGVDDAPVVICWGEHVLRKPTVKELADCLGLGNFDEGVRRDVVVVGAGPAGLAAAVYSASEGLDVLVLESYAPGGQAGSSSRIENYLGFPMGVSGNELAARAFFQAEKFGASIAVARTAAELECNQRPYRVRLASDCTVDTHAIVIATGAEYRKPDCEEAVRFEGVGLYYAATPVESKVCTGEEVVVVGGGNSAGQAATFIAGCAKRVYMLVRGEGLSESMSQYLIGRIEETPNIELRTCTEITRFEGDEHLERVEIVDSRTDERTTLDVGHVFWMAGADPNTTWLDGCILLDDKGFIKTGSDLTDEDLRLVGWPLDRRPFLFEASLPGVFAVGDVRSSSVKRVAAAVGEGSVCVQLVHRVIAEQRDESA